MRSIHFALSVLLTVISLTRVAAQGERRVEGGLVQVVSSDKTPNSAVLIARDIIN